MHVQQSICRLKVRDFVVLVTLLMFWVSPRIGFSQQPSVAPSQGAPTAATSTPESKGEASLANPMVSVQPRLQAPIHIVPFREPGAVTTKLKLFPAGSHVDYFGGPVISSVHVVMVLYGPGAYLPNIAGTASPTMANFYNDITKSTFFDMLSEYSTTGVKAVGGTAGTNQFIGHGFFDGQFTITPAAANNGATITDIQIQAELLSQVNAGNLPAPIIDAQGNNNTLYMIFFPPGKTINDGTSNSCVRGGFCAYHNSTNSSFATHRLFYGVMPDLQPPSGCATGCGGGTTFDMATNVTSHELSEAVTDADVGPATTFGPPLAWLDQVNGEIGDICVGQEAGVLANGTTYTVQQEFSNLQNNCVSAPPQFLLTSTGNPSGGQSFDVDLRIADSVQGFTVPYVGIVHFTSSDGTAVLPADYTFTSADAGLHHFVLTLNTGGQQTITVTDTRLPGFTGSSTFQVNAPNVAALRIIAPGTATTGTPVNFSITALDATNTPVTNYNGTVHFTSSDGTAVLPANSPMVNGVGSFTATFNTAGFQTFQANDVANTSVSGSGFVTATAPSAHPTTTTLTGGPTGPIVFGQQAIYLMTVTGNAGNVSGSFNATLDGSSFVSGGIFNTATVAVNPPGGTHTIFANYTGDGTNAPSSSSPITVVVNPAPSSMTVSSSLSSAPSGKPVTFTATPSPFVLSRGSVTFFDGTSPLGILPVNQAFNGGLTVTALSAGTHSITAAFSGSPDLLPSTSASIQQVITAPLVPDYSVVPDKTSATLLAGQAATFNITTNSVNGFTGSVSFSCGRLPSLTTCTFSPSIVSVSAGSTINTVLTVKTTGPHAALIAPRTSPSRSVYATLWTLSPVALGIVFLIGKKRNLRRTGMLVGLVVLFMVSGLTSCGGGPTTPPPPPVPQTTPAGAATFTVTAKGTATTGASPANPSQQLSITITVQP
jgi:hypothetical protein